MPTVMETVLDLNIPISFSRSEYLLDQLKIYIRVLLTLTPCSSKPILRSITSMFLDVLNVIK